MRPKERGQVPVAQGRPVGDEHVDPGGDAAPPVRGVKNDEKKR